VRLIKQRTTLSQSLDVELDAATVILFESEVPVPNLRLEFHLTPRHSTHAISRLAGLR
jgi:hypothetical protein